MLDSRLYLRDLVVVRRARRVEARRRRAIQAAGPRVFIFILESGTATVQSGLDITELGRWDELPRSRRVGAQGKAGTDAATEHSGNVHGGNGKVNEVTWPRHALITVP